MKTNQRRVRHRPVLGRYREAQQTSQTTSPDHGGRPRLTQPDVSRLPSVLGNERRHGHGVGFLPQGFWGFYCPFL